MVPLLLVYSTSRVLRFELNLGVMVNGHLKALFPTDFIVALVGFAAHEGGDR